MTAKARRQNSPIVVQSARAEAVSPRDFMVRGSRQGIVPQPRHVRHALGLAWFGGLEDQKAKAREGPGLAEQKGNEDTPFIA